MKVYLFVSKMLGPEVTRAQIAGITVHGAPLIFAIGRGRMHIGKRQFLAHDYEVINWIGGDWGNGLVSVIMSPHAAAALVNWLRDSRWEADDLPPQLLEAWTFGKIWNTDLMRLEAQA